MHICFECSKELPVKKYGGTERIIFWLMCWLVKQGHRVSLIGHPSSDVKKYGINLIPHKGGDYRSLIPKDVDLLHLFYTPGFELDCPFLVTIEGNGKQGEVFLPNTLFISKKHAENHGSTHFVYNGIDEKEYPLEKTSLKWDNFLFLAKAKWKVKNLDACVKACKKAKKTLHIAGGKYFHLFSKIKSYGMVGQEEKNKLLNLSDALLNPVRWHEPFGISIIEAFAKGVPVIGSCYGSLPELIQPVAGIICRNYEEFEQHIMENHSFNPRSIRDYFEKNFTVDMMGKNYIKYYEKILDGESIHNYQPKAQFTHHPEDLLPF